MREMKKDQTLDFFYLKLYYWFSYKIFMSKRFEGGIGNYYPELWGRYEMRGIRREDLIPGKKIKLIANVVLLDNDTGKVIEEVEFEVEGRANKETVLAQALQEKIAGSYGPTQKHSDEQYDLELV